MMIIEKGMNVVKEKITGKKISVMIGNKKDIKEKESMIMKEIEKEITDDKNFTHINLTENFENNFISFIILF